MIVTLFLTFLPRPTNVSTFFPRRTNFPARLTVYYHLVERCGMSVTNAEKATGVSINAVSKGIICFKEIMENHKEINASINQLSLK